MGIAEAYAELGLAPGASMDDVRAAWRHAARRWHPDRAVEDPEEAARKFSLAQAAYTYLSTNLRTQPNLTTENPSTQPQLPEHDPFAHIPGPTQDGEDLHVHVPVTLGEVLSAQDVIKEVKVTYPLPHGACDGHGCGACNGGVVTHTAVARVKVPQGLAGTATVTRPRRGGPGWGGGRPGDMTVTYDVLEEPGWSLKEGTLHGTATITVARSLLGGTTTVRTPAEVSIEVEVPSSGTGTVRVPQAGVPTPNGPGDAVIEVKVRKLDTANPAVRRALEALHEAEGGV